MSLINSLPLDLENIINSYKYQMEHIEKFQSTLDMIKEINYHIDNKDYSQRSYGNTSVHYYYELNQDETLYNSVYKLWIHTYMTEYETITTIYETINCIDIVIEEDIIDIDNVEDGWRYQL